MFESFPKRHNTLVKCRVYKLLLAVTATLIILLLVMKINIKLLTETSNSGSSSNNNSSSDGLMRNVTDDDVEYQELSDILYFNRIPKTGSENMAYIISHLSTQVQLL